MELPNKCEECKLTRWINNYTKKECSLNGEDIEGYRNSRHPNCLLCVINELNTGVQLTDDDISKAFSRRTDIESTHDEMIYISSMEDAKKIIIEKLANNYVEIDHTQINMSLTCPNCETTVDKSDNFCKFCGVRIVHRNKSLKNKRYE